MAELNRVDQYLESHLDESLQELRAFGSD